MHNESKKFQLYYNKDDEELRKNADKADFFKLRDGEVKVTGVGQPLYCCN